MAFKNLWDNMGKLYRDEIVLADPAETRATRRPKIGEKTPLGGYIRSYMTKYLSDPDKILRYKSGGKYRELYDDMIAKDTQIRSNLSIRKNDLLGIGYEIMPYVEEGQSEPTPEAINRADIIRTIFKRMRNLQRNLREVLSAYEHGFSVNEIIYRIDPDYVVIDQLRSRCPDYFKYDKDYNLVYTQQAGKEEVMKPEYFVQHSFDPKYENPYGSSLLQTVYWPWWFKSNLIKYLMIFSERFGQPPIVGSYPRGWTQSQIDALVDSLDSIQNDTVGAVEEGTELTMLEAKVRSESSFIAGCQYFDAQISKGILGQTLSTDEGQSSGSYALGKVHASVRLDLLEADAKDMSFTITDQMVRPLCRYNFGTDDQCPTFVIPFKAPEDLETLSRVYGNLGKDLKVEFTKSHIHDKFGIPMPEEGEDTYGGRGEIPPQLKPPDGGFPFKHKRFGVTPPAGSKVYDIADSLYFYDEMFGTINRIYTRIQAELLKNVDLNSPMYGLIDQIVRELMESGEMQTYFGTTIGNTVQRSAEGMASAFGLGKLEQALERQTFEAIKNEYLTRNFYGKGRLNGIADTMRGILKNKIPAWSDPRINFDVRDMKKLLNTSFTDLADWKIHQIVQTELSEAANYAVFEMVEKTGLDFDAWFFVDPDSCETCQSWAANSPYTVNQAKAMGLPHIQCNDQWSFTKKK